MKTIWKFPLAPDCVLDMPIGAKVLTVQMQGDAVMLWALVDALAPKEQRRFLVYGTGHEILDAGALTYVATFQMGGGVLVFHAFEVSRPDPKTSGEG